jgi:hypothetical protein
LPSFVDSLIQAELLDLEFLYGASPGGNGLKISNVRPPSTTD